MGQTQPVVHITDTPSTEAEVSRRKAEKSDSGLTMSKDHAGRLALLDDLSELTPPAEKCQRAAPLLGCRLSSDTEEARK